jgi:hypothetical protein
VKRGTVYFTVEMGRFSTNSKLDFSDDLTVRDLLCRLPRIVSRRLRWDGPVARMEK